MVRLVREAGESERNKEDESIIKGGREGGRERGPESPHSHNLLYCIVLRVLFGGVSLLLCLVY